MKDLAIGDLDNSGPPEIVIGGRGIGTVDAGSVDTGRYRWVNKWTQPDGSAGEGDWNLVEEIQLTDLNSDGIKDVVGGALDALYAFDGRTGSTLWRTHDPTRASFDGAYEVALADFNDDGTQDVVFGDIFDEGISAVDGRTGESLWFTDRSGVVADLQTADVNGDGFTDVIVAGYVDAGFEVYALSGLGAADSGTATPLWVQSFKDQGLTGDPMVVSIGQVVPGAAPEVVVGGSSGQIEVLDGSLGVPLGVWSADNAVADLVLAPVDDVDGLDIVATATDLSREPTGGSVSAFNAVGDELWSQEAAGPPLDLELSDIDATPGPELIVGGGFRTPEGRTELDGFVQMMELPADSTNRVVWTKPLADWVGAVAAGETADGPTVLAGQGKEGGVAALDPQGEPRWYFRTGGRIEELTTANLDAEGAPEVVEVADDSFVAAHEANGNILWAKRVPGIGGPQVMQAEDVNLDSDPSDEIVVGTFEVQLPTGETPAGRLHAYSSDGEHLWSVDLPGGIKSLVAQDMDGDSEDDIVAVTSIEGQVGRYDTAGSPVWEVPLDTDYGASATLTDITGDGVSDVVIGTKQLVTGHLYALDGVDGSEIWGHPEDIGLNWVSSGAGKLVGGDLAGQVYEINPADGSKTWLVDPGGSSWEGSVTADADGDGTIDVVSVSEDGATRTISGVDGHTIWTTPTREEASGFQVATLQGDGGPVIATGSFGIVSGVQLLDGITGKELSFDRTDSYILDVIGSNLAGDETDEVVAGAGWELEQRPLP